jgi:hypothetical protein
MKDLMRTLVAAVVGAVVAIAVVVGQPALAGQVEKAKAKKITSAQIKNGTIKTKDLSAEVTRPLGKAGTALQSVPDNSVTSAKIADGSLSAGDIATSSGTVSFDFPQISAGSCIQTPGIDTGHNLDNDLILINKPLVFLTPLEIAGQQSGSPGSSEFSLEICNVYVGTLDPPLATFTYAVIRN